MIPAEVPGTFEASSLDVYNLMRNIRSSAAGLEGIPGVIYKKFALLLCDPLMHIFNNCLHLQYFPTIWKRAYIILVPKNNSDFKPI